MRRRSLCFLATVGFAVCCSASSLAQPSPPLPAADAAADAALDNGLPSLPSRDDPTVVESLIVRAARPGPAFWKVTLGDSTVWVMGVPAALPKNMAWKHDELKAHLRNARVLIVGTGGVTFNVIDFFRILLTAKQFKGDQPLDKVLPPDLMARFEKARTRLKVSDRILELKPALAAIFLSASFMRPLNMEQDQPEQAIMRDAFLRVGTKRVGRSEVIDLLKILEDMPPVAAQTCVEDALRQIDGGRRRQMEAARGWTTGDLRIAVSAERGWEHCIADDPKFAAETERNTREVTAAIVEALKKPGKSVAVVDLRPLLGQNGILVRLAAIPGVVLTAPDAPGLEDEIGAEAAEPEVKVPAA